MMVSSSVFNTDQASKTLDNVLGSRLTRPSLASVKVNALSLDSRSIKAGDVFVALKGDLYDGKNYIAQALKKGAVAVLLDKDEILEDKKLNTALIAPVENINQALSAIAANFYDKPSEKLSVVGITGTNGKTSCAQFFAQAVALLGEPCGVMGTTGFGVFKYKAHDGAVGQTMSSTGMTTPDPINVQKILAQFVEEKVGHCAIEVSSHGLVQHRVAAVSIKTAIFTNLSHDHLDYHGTMAAYGQAKAQLFAMPSVKHAVINLDDDYSSALFKSLGEHVSLMTYSVCRQKTLLPSAAHFSLESIEILEGQFTKAILLLEQDGHQSRYPFVTSLMGQFNLSNLLAVIAALYAESFSIKKITDVIADIKTIDGRMERVNSNNSPQVLVDFAHTPDALEKALRALKPYTKSQLWCVFGCGGDRDKAKRPQMAAIAEALADHIVITSDNPRTEQPELILDDVASGFNASNFYRIADRAEAIAYAIEHASEADTILIAGKGHENYQIIGSEKHYFSDQEQARIALTKRDKRCAND